MIDAINMRSGYAFLMPSIFGIHQSSALSEISSQFHDECSAVSGPLLHRQLAVKRRAQELGLRSGDVGDRMQADRLGDDATPPGLERPHDVAVGFGRRRRRQQERVGELQSRERDGDVGLHCGGL